MVKILLLILCLSFGISSNAQTLESDCNCDIEITDKNDKLPGNGNAYGPTKNKTICFKGDFDYKLDWANLGNNVTLCVGEDVQLKSAGLTFEGSKTIYNYGEFEFGQNLTLDSNSRVVNYGTMESKFNFEGGSLENLNTADMTIKGYSNFNSGSIYNDFTSYLDIDQKNWTGLQENFSLESQGEIKFSGEVENRGNLTLAGQSDFEKKLTNLGYANLSGKLKFEEGYNSNSSQAVTETNGFLEIDGDVNLWQGYLEANAGLNFKDNTRLNEGARLRFMGEAKFKNLNSQGEILTSYSCNTFIADVISGYGGKITALDNSSIYIEELKDIPNNWVLSGDISQERCGNDSKVIVWLGTESSDTENEKNWSDELQNKSNILIPKTRNNPVITTSLNGFDVLVKTDAELTNRNQLQLIGNLKVEGKLHSTEGEIKFKGNKLQTIDLNTKTNIDKLIIDNENNVELVKGSIDIYNKVEITNGDLITNHPGGNSEENLITFKSDSINTAVISETTNGRIVGNIRIENYLSKSNRSSRYISSSVNSTGSIRDNWQEGVNNTVNNYASNKNPNPGYGTHITGSKQGKNGFDASLTGNASLFFWNINSAKWNSVSNTDQNQLRAGQAFSLLVRGDRRTNIYSSNSTYTGSTTLRSIGEMAFGDIDVTNELSKAPYGFSLIGNPYQSEVDLRKALRESSSQLKQQFYYAWSPALQTRGGYVTVDLDSDPVDFVPSQKGARAGNQINAYLQPNQSVFIETAATADEQNQPSLVFKEEHKISNSTPSNKAFSTPAEVGKIDLTLIRKADDKIVDGVRFKFDKNYNNEVNESDASKIWNSEESFSILSNGENYLAIEKRQYPEVDQKLNFWIGNYTSQDYTMLVELSEIKAFKVYFKDLYTEEMIELNNGENKINFSVDSSVSESSASDRFEVTFEPITLSIQDNELASKTQLYPNPSSTGVVYLKYQDTFEGDADVELFSMVGQKVEISKERVSNSELKLNTSTLSSGIYLVKLTNGKQSTTQKLIIQ